MDARSVANKTKKLTTTQKNSIIGKKCSNVEAAENKKQNIATEKENKAAE